MIALLLILANSITDSLTKDDVQAYIEDVIAEFQVKLRRAAHAEKRRVKREVTMEDFKRNLPQCMCSLFSYLPVFLKDGV